MRTKRVEGKKIKEKEKDREEEKEARTVNEKWKKLDVHALFFIVYNN